MNSDDQFAFIASRLEAILKLLAIQMTLGKKAGEAASVLDRAGLDRKLISEVLGTSQDSVRALLSQSKKGKQNRKEALFGSAGK
jgi:hypothetical protein